MQNGPIFLKEQKQPKHSNNGRLQNPQNPQRIRIIPLNGRPPQEDPITVRDKGIQEGSPVQIKITLRVDKVLHQKHRDQP